MNGLKQLILTYILPGLAFVGVMGFSCTNQSDNEYKICNQEYALCSAALCVPKPGDPSKTICFCDVHEGKNLATVSCDKLAPTVDKNGIKTIFSTYSTEKANEGNKVMTCPGGTPWSWCLNKQCTVDPSNPKKAICICDVKRNTGDWVTYGGGCDTSTCSTAYWSGATVDDDKQATQVFLKALGIEKSPVKWCPAS